MTTATDGKPLELIRYVPGFVNDGETGHGTHDRLRFDHLDELLAWPPLAGICEQDGGPINFRIHAMQVLNRETGQGQLILHYRRQCGDPLVWAHVHGTLPRLRRLEDEWRAYVALWDGVDVRLAKQIVDTLNRLLDRDCEAMRRLYSCETPCSDKLAAYPGVQTLRKGDQASLRWLGVLNAICGKFTDGWGMIAAVEDANGELTRYRLLQPTGRLAKA